MRFVGLTAIGQAIGRGPHAVIKLASRSRDPLPLRRLFGSTWGWSPYLLEWARRQENDPELPRLVGWQAIAEVLHTAAETARRWADRDEDPLPVENRGTRGAEPIWAYSGAIRDWMHRHDRTYVTGEARPRRAMATTAEVCS